MVKLSPEYRPLAIEAMGHGERQKARLNKHGFPIGHKAGAKTFAGFQTGDLVRARIPKGRHAGTHVGRIGIRFRPSFAVRTAADIFDVHPKYLTLIQRSDGYAYS